MPKQPWWDGTTIFRNESKVGFSREHVLDRVHSVIVALSGLINKNSLQSALYGGQFVLLGTGTKGSSNVFEGFSLLQDSMKLSFEIADQKIAAGLLHLEAGQPQQAATLFQEAILNIEPSSSWRPLLNRYYLQITGEVLK